MDYIQRLPFILGIFTALIVGVVSYKLNFSLQETYIKMAISMGIFFILGLYARSTLIKIVEEIDRKKMQEEIQRIEELRRQENQDLSQNAKEKTHTVEYTIDDGADDFEPFNVSEIIKTKEN
ncbi:MAG: hypothetical protein N3B21_10390 [Clostridia bacterium]|nr:hypothetical protein [Clostridia bacterium]